jgi:hypothetical protein
MKATSFSKAPLAASGAYHNTSQVAVASLLAEDKRLLLFMEVLDVNRKGWRLGFFEVEKALQLSGRQHLGVLFGCVPSQRLSIASEESCYETA